ncbi:Lsr2 family protein [Pseudonocardia sp. ICBG601]|uniref:Lsr2 family protein n=1 Tax=Pseudonocardia sp. ICBG601 TaxID=2846759 RepID=UPI001CF68F14|nr:Lsr2 family protein [Pseudonocardia sp. ICBG601]
MQQKTVVKTAGKTAAGSKGAGKKGGVKPGQDPVLGKYTSPRALLHHWRQVERIADLEIGAVPAGVGKSGHPQGFTATVSARLLVGDTVGEVVVCRATEGAKMKACDVAAYALAKILRPIMDAAAGVAAPSAARSTLPSGAGVAVSAPSDPEPMPEPGRVTESELGFAPAGSSPAAPSVAAPSAAGLDARVVREWARSQGYSVGERGRLPAHVRRLISLR